MGAPRAIRRQPEQWVVRAYWALGSALAVAWWVAIAWGCEPEMHAFVMVSGILATIADAPMIYVVAREAALGHPVVALLATSRRAAEPAQDLVAWRRRALRGSAPLLRF